MLLLIESFLTQGLMFFMTLGESLYYFLTKQEAPTEEPLPLWGLPRSVVSSANQDSTSKNGYSASLLTEEQEQFFQQFLSVNEMEDCRKNDYVESVTIKEEPTNDVELLSMASWEEIEPQTVSVSSKLAAKADCRIKDLVMGEQLWVVEVVGEEQGYLHVSDGSGREWINGSFSNNVHKGDILSILVDRITENNIELLAIDILQEFSSDFSIADDLMLIENNNQEESYVVA